MRLSPLFLISVGSLAVHAVCPLPMESTARLFAAQPIITPVISWNVTQWKEWRDQQIDYILEPTVRAHRELLLSRARVIARSAEAYELLAPFLDADPQFFARASERGKAMSHFAAFVKAQHWMAERDNQDVDTHALGLEIPDVDYPAYAAADTSFPELLKTQEFLKKMAAPGTYQAAVAMIDRHNRDLPADRKWIVLPFKAQFIKSVDRTTYGRLLVLVPNVPAPNGDLIDQWILYAIATPDQVPVPHIKSVSMVALHRKPRRARKTKAYLMDFMRETAADGAIKLTPTQQLADRPSENCYDCHKAAVIPIFPEVEFAFDPAGKLVPKTSGQGEIPTVINRLIRAYGAADFGPMETDAYGPSIGPEGRKRSDQFIRSATADLRLPAGSYDRIRGAMNCAKCHNSFAKLNYLLAVRSDRDLKVFKDSRGMLHTYIEKGYMPPDTNLSAIEREALWRCLINEYYDSGSRKGVLVDWLKP